MTREEAIEKVRKMSLPKETMEILEALAPELRESEDERIRKDILCFLKAKLENYTAPTPAKSTLSMWIAYLEKQKESLHITETCKENADSFTDEDEMIRRKMIEHFKSKTKDTWCNMPVKSIISYLEKQKEEEGYEAIPVESTLEYKLGFNAGKEARWRPTEEQVDALERTVRLSNFGCDKERRNALLSLLEQLKQGDGKQEEQKPNFDTHWENGSMVYEQKEQKFAEWSEEEAKKAAEDYADEFPGMTHENDGSTIEDYDKPYNDFLAGVLWAKHHGIFQKGNTHWKPSEEQMEALQNAVALTACDKELARLYNQLKKLM